MDEKQAQKLILKIAPSEWKNESRDKREIGVIKELGADILVLAKGKKTGVIERIEGFDIYRVSTRPLGNHIPNTINRIISIFTWAWQARKISPDIISGHDIFGVFIGYLSSVFVSKEKRPKLVYDSHEFEIGRNIKRNKLQILAITYLEHFLIKRCEFCIVVNDSIANEVQRIHKLNKRPIVVRNIPETWQIDAEVCKKKRQDLLKKLNGTVKILLMYHGVVGEERGIETLLDVASNIKDVGIIILGNCDSKSYKGQLLNKAKSLKILDRVLFQNAVPIKDLWKYVGAIDVSMVLIAPTSKSYYYALPNKLFESIQALTPVIASDLPEMRKIIAAYNIGFLNAPSDINGIVKCVDIMKNNKTQYDLFKKNLISAKKELCWENEKKILIKAYEKII